MTDLHYIAEAQAAHTQDGSAVIIAAVTIEQKTLPLAIQPHKVGELILRLLRVLAVPIVRKHYPAREYPIVGEIKAVSPPFELDSLSIGIAEMDGHIVVNVGFPGVESIGCAILPEQADQLSRDLLTAAQRVRTSRAQKPH